jgi:hypothetical protein
LATGGSSVATAEDKIEIYGQYNGTNLPAKLLDTNNVTSDRVTKD